MFRRLTIGLRFSRREAWIGGVYYVRNLVCALRRLPRDRRPGLLIVGGDKAILKELKDATGYPGLERTSRTRIERAPVRALPFPPDRRTQIDLILLGSPPGLEDRAVLWIPDLQEQTHPEFFPPEEREARRAHHAARLEAHRHVMVSSQDVAEGLRRFYGFSGHIHVIRFASFFEPPANPASVRDKYSLPERYFICSNQVWKHKNHAVVIRALAEARDGTEPPMVFTGLEEEPRDPGYPASLWALASDLGAAPRLRRLGFLPREDQLALMAGAIAVVQPSLSEGWSTVVEDAKALGRHVIASDIPVHREQLGPGADVFAPDDPHALARLLRRCAETPPATPPLDYAALRQRFAEDLWRMIDSVERDLRRRRTPRLVISR